jgi:16S rRNA (guanine527-N7)-methyltransferase
MTSTENDLRATLLDGLRELQLDLNAQQIDQLLAYQALIAKWTQVYNLTAVRDPLDMMTHHVLDSLAAVPALQRYLRSAGLAQGSRLLDVGSGAGLPGVVIAVCCPAVAVTCVDAVAKKAAFITQSALTLKLPNLIGLHSRVENITESFDVICSRAFASLADYTKLSAAALAPQGVWMAMKGKHPVDELPALPENIAMFHVEQLRVPGLQAERCILWLRPVS